MRSSSRAELHPAPADDAALVAQAQAELPYRTGAFEALVRRHGGRIKALTRRFVSSAADAEDLAQDILLKLFFELPRFRGEAAFSTWLWRLAANACIDHQRRCAARPAQVEDVQSCPEIVDTRDAIGATEARIDTERLLQRLPAQDRLIVLLRLQVGLEFAEVAQAVGLGLSAVKMRYQRAIERLRAG
ncbi:MAG: RNA polymerase sigma factor [Thiomonas sp.]